MVRVHCFVNIWQHRVSWPTFTHFHRYFILPYYQTVCLSCHFEVAGLFVSLCRISALFSHWISELPLFCRYPRLHGFSERIHTYDIILLISLSFYLSFSPRIQQDTHVAPLIVGTWIVFRNSTRKCCKLCSAKLSRPRCHSNATLEQSRCRHVV
jgi:hypothetical protein